MFAYKKEKHCLYNLSRTNHTFTFAYKNSKQSSLTWTDATYYKLCAASLQSRNILPVKIEHYISESHGLLTKGGREGETERRRGIPEERKGREREREREGGIWRVDDDCCTVRRIGTHKFFFHYADHSAKNGMIAKVASIDPSSSRISFLLHRDSFFSV